MATILVINDEAALVTVIRDALARDNHHIEISPDGINGLRSMENNKFDVVILDTAPPRLSGLSICRRYRQNRGTSRIILISGKGKLQDKTEGLEAGADDYLTKPFHPKELAARVRALLRRSPEQIPDVVSFLDVEIDTIKPKITKQGNPVHLSPREFHLIEFFVRNPRTVYSAEDLLACVWDSQTELFPDTVRGHIKKIRKKLDSCGQSSIIETVYGVGYRLGKTSNALAHCEN
jgi:Response regulators consisting of a CheY-like receiver domain and a winged-helix DNA-binding domain